MASLSQLKKSRGNNLDKLKEKVNSQGGGQKRDERIWKPTFNKDKGKGTFVVRFIPSQEGEPFYEVKSHSFAGPGGNYFANARETLGEKDPVQIAAINAFKRAKADDDKPLREEAMKFLPKRQYYANVYVVKDEEKPENEGCVFIYQFGPQIFNIIKTKIEPEFEDDEAMDPFDFWEGADFKIRVVSKGIPDKKTGNQIEVPNYEKSQFEDKSEFMDGDEDKLQEILDRTYDLSEFVDPEKFPSEEEVKERFKKVTGKPYNWLSPDAEENNAKEKAEKADEDRRLNEEQDNEDGSDDHREDDQSTTADQTDTGDQVDSDEEEDPVAKFRRMANGG